MSKLSTTMCQVLTKTAIENLSQRKIFTVHDVLQEDPKKLAFISKLDFKDIVTLRQSLVTNYSPFPRLGMDVYSEFLSRCSYIPSGIPNLDSLLGGGFLTGNIYEICGCSGSGKTQLCLTIAANVVLQIKKVVHFIDTKLDFSGKRIHSIIGAREPNEDTIGNSMEKILVTRIHDFYELYSFLYQLKNQLVREPGSLRVIIIESLPSIFLQYMGSHQMDGLGLLNNLANLLKYIAHEHYVTIIVVNLATVWVTEESAPLNDDGETPPTLSHTELKPVLGKYWTHVPNTRLYIEQCTVPNERKVSVIKSTHLAMGSSCLVSLMDDGVQ